MRRAKPAMVYLLSTTLIILIALTIHYQSEIIHAQAAEVEKARHLLQVEEEREALQEQLEEERQARQQAEHQRQELQDLLTNQAITYQIVTSGLENTAGLREEMSPILSRAGRETITGVTMPINAESGFTAALYEKVWEEKGAVDLHGTGEALIMAEEIYGVSSLVLAAIIVHESAWGRSAIARNKNNLAGLGAYDSDPYNCAHSFNSKTDSIFCLAELLSTHYDSGGKYFGGDFNLKGVNVCYATDQGWAGKVANTMNLIAKTAVDDPGALLTAAQITTG